MEMGWGKMSFEGLELASINRPVGYDISSYEYQNQLIHHVKNTANVGPAERLPMFLSILENNKTDCVYCIFDNQDGYISESSVEDMQMLDNLFIQRGIKHFCGIFVTPDEKLGVLVTIAGAALDHFKMDGEVQVMSHLSDAANYIKSDIDSRQS